MNRLQRKKQLKDLYEDLERKIEPLKNEYDELCEHKGYFLYTDSNEESPHVEFVLRQLDTQQKEIYKLIMDTCKNKNKSLFELFYDLGNKYNKTFVHTTFRVIQILGGTIYFTDKHFSFEDLLHKLKDVEPKGYSEYWNENIN